MNARSPASAGAILRGALPGLVLATLVLLPFVDKAFTIDDTVFLFEAVHATKDPLHPTAFEMAWTHEVQRVSAFVPTGPVTAWLLVPAVLAENSERAAHVMQLSMLWLAVIATVALALRLGLSPAWAAASGLLLGATPAVLGMAGTAMPDVPAMALSAAGIWQLLAWLQDRRARQAFLAAILLGLAPLARTHLILLFGVGALFTAGDVFSLRAWRAAPWSRWLPLMIAPVVSAGVMVLTRDPSPSSVSIAGAAAGFSTLEHLAPNVLAFAVHWALAFPFTLPWVLLRWRPILARWSVLFAAAVVTSVLLYVARPKGSPWLVPVATLSIAALVDVLLDALRKRDSTQFTLGIWLLLALPTAIYLHLPSKYCLASAPAAAILVARAMASAPRLGRAVLAATTAASVLLGVAILRADATFAGLGRTAAQTLIAPAVARGHRVWYVGHWGFQWYAERAGARFFPVTPPFPRTGDLVVACVNCEPHLWVDEMGELVPLKRVRHRDPGGRVMDRATGSGFFSNTWGYLPWSWGDSVVDGFDVFRVEHRD